MMSDNLSNSSPLHIVYCVYLSFLIYFHLICSFVFRCFSYCIHFVPITFKFCHLNFLSLALIILIFCLFCFLSVFNWFSHLCFIDFLNP